jgi:hypothetical protein
MEPRSIAAKRSETPDFDVTAPLLTAAVAQPANCKRQLNPILISLSSALLRTLSSLRLSLFSPDFPQLCGLATFSRPIPNSLGIISPAFRLRLPPSRY